MSRQGLCALVCIAVVSSAVASEGWYVNGSYYQTELEKADSTETIATTSCVLTACTTTISQTSMSTGFDDADHWGVAVGYDTAGPMRLDLEFRENDHDLSGGGSGSRELRTLLFNLWYDFSHESDLRPYLGGGIGASDINERGAKDTAVTAQLGFGLAWEFADRWALDAGYRYFEAARDPELEDGQRRVDTELEGSSLLLGLRYNFFSPGPRDSDGDGVVNRSDQCPGTPGGVAVDMRGCPQDRDGDGLADYLDRCPDSTPGAVVDSEGCEEVARSIVLEGVNFAINSAQLTEESYAVCQRVAKTLQSVPSRRYEVQGHTDSLGAANYNRNLSQRRAESVRACLIDEGVDASRLEAVGYGEDKPIAGNESAGGRAENRRVVLVALN